MYLEQPRSILSQGDIFTGINLIDSASPTSPPKQFDILVLSHTCEINKPENSTVLVCAIKPADQLNESNRGHLRSGRLYNAMHLEPIVSLPESFLDFRFIFRVEKALLEEYARQGLRIASLNDETLLALGAFLYRFISRNVPVPDTIVVQPSGFL